MRGPSSEFPRTGPKAVNPTAGSNRRPHGGSRTRFVGTGHHGNQAAAALRSDHPALIEGRTLFPTRVIAIADAPRVLVSGKNNAKIGDRVEKGPWAGMPIFTLTLEERATCPRSCFVWAECYGNALHFSRRHAHGPELVKALDGELRALAGTYSRGFVVRLHILGDFYSTEYAAAWARWMRDIPQLRVWGYTARQPDTEIGDLIGALNDGWPDRWRMRFSVASDAPIGSMQVTTIWRQPESPRVAEGLSCPQQRDKFATCGGCGICFQPGMEGERIVFTGHGRRGGRHKAVAP